MFRWVLMCCVTPGVVLDEAPGWLVGVLCVVEVCVDVVRHSRCPGG